MDTPDEPTQRGRHGVTFRYGVWVAPSGTRSEVVRVGEAWRVYTYSPFAGDRPEQISEYTNQAELARAIARLEAQGHQYEPDRRPHGTRTRSHAASGTQRGRSMRAVIGTAVLCILFLVIEIYLLRR
jgi:hypothetical protein